MTYSDRLLEQVEEMEEALADERAEVVRLQRERDHLIEELELLRGPTLMHIELLEAELDAAKAEIEEMRNILKARFT